MTTWYAVGLGVLVAVVGSVVGSLVPGFGQLAAVALGGATAGYLAGGLRGGFWHGLLTGAVPALVASGVFAATLVVADIGFEPLGAMAGAVGFDSFGSVFSVSAFGLVLAIGVAFFAVVGGVGGVVGGALARL